MQSIRIRQASDQLPRTGEEEPVKELLEATVARAATKVVGAKAAKEAIVKLVARRELGGNALGGTVESVGWL